MTTEQSDLRRKAYMLAKELGLDRQARIELSNVILPNAPEHDSWQDLTDEQLGRILDAMHGYAFIRHLRDT